MSHFTVIVPANDEDDLHSKLIPYKEYGFGWDDDGLEPYLEFVNKGTDAETVERYESGTVEKIKMPDGRVLSPYDDEFKVIGAGILNKFHIVPDDLERVRVPFKELYPTFQAFISDWEGYNFLEEYGAYGYIHNPNAKWDWYEVGGRWTGIFKLKSNATGENGIPGLLTESNDDPTRADIALADDIDWQAMLCAQMNNYMKSFYDFKAALCEVRGRVYDDKVTAPMSQAGKQALEMYRSDDGRGKYCRAAFHSEQDYVESRMVDVVLRERELYTFDSFTELADKFYLSSAEYTEKFSNRALSHAFIDLDGHWVERGEMGWFAMCDDENEDIYDKAFWDFIETLPADQKVYAVDCHI